MAVPLGAGGTDLLNQILFASAWLPVVIIGVLCWWFFRAARRNDRAEAAEAAAAQSAPPQRKGNDTHPEKVNAKGSLHRNVHQPATVSPVDLATEELLSEHEDPDNQDGLDDLERAAKSKTTPTLTLRPVSPTVLPPKGSSAVDLLTPAASRRSKKRGRGKSTSWFSRTL